MSTAQANLSQTDLSRFSGLRLDAKHDPEAAMKKVAREFEALFVQIMLKAAREAGGQDGVMDSNESRLYHEMFDDQIALTVAEDGGMGIEQMLRRQFADQLRQHGADEDLTAKMLARLPARRAFPVLAHRQSAVDAVGGNDEVVEDVSTWRAATASAARAGGAEIDAGRKHFADSLRQHAERAAAKLGTSAEILIAQAALETGWGKHVMPVPGGGSSHNLFSIKADPSWDGNTVTRSTLEFMEGRPVRINAGFRSYEDIGHAFDDYAEFIASNPRYQRALEKAADPRAYVRELQRAGYATDPDYARKILQIHQQVASVATDNRG